MTLPLTGSVHDFNGAAYTLTDTLTHTLTPTLAETGLLNVDTSI